MTQDCKDIQKAEESGVTPIEYVDNIVALFKQLWKELNISNDDFIRTTEERHREVVQMLFQRAYDNGDIYLGKYEGWYCIPDEAFWPDNRMKPDNLFPYQMNISRPKSFKFFRIINNTRCRYIVNKRVKPHINNMLGIKWYRNAPRKTGS